MPLLVASDGACLVNTSSINGCWASLGPTVPHTPYSAAKFAVKGFTEALIADLRVHAPHVKVALVMPGTWALPSPSIQTGCSARRNPRTCRGNR